MGFPHRRVSGASWCGLFSCPCLWYRQTAPIRNQQPSGAQSRSVLFFEPARLSSWKEIVSRLAHHLFLGVTIKLLTGSVPENVFQLFEHL